MKKRLPVIVTTGFSTEATAIDTTNIVVSSYLTKPFKLAKVLAISNWALGG
mgnify:FL=1